MTYKKSEIIAKYTIKTALKVFKTSIRSSTSVHLVVAWGLSATVFKQDKERLVHSHWLALWHCWAKQLTGVLQNPFPANVYIYPHHSVGIPLIYASWLLLQWSSYKSLFIAQRFSQDLSRNKSGKSSVDSGDWGSMLAGLTEVSLYVECLLAVITLTSDYLAVHIQLSAPEVSEVLLGGPSLEDSLVMF